MKMSTDRLISQFKALADPVRVRLVALCAVTECSVSELTQVTGHSQPRISQQLKQLCAAELLERFRDGHFVYYRLAEAGRDASRRRRLIALLPDAEPAFAKDLERLRELRTQDNTEATGDTEADRSLHRALVELTVARPLGDLLDIGCGHGQILKLLASRSKRAVGVDVDPDARRLARAGLLLAGTANCSLRQGSMYDLPFADGEFDTVVLDDVLLQANDPAGALREAVRLLSPDGRILLLASTVDGSANDTARRFAELAADTELRLTRPRAIPVNNPAWLLAVATPISHAVAA